MGTGGSGVSDRQPAPQSGPGRYGAAVGSTARHRHKSRDRMSSGQRRCTRNGCPEPAIATLTYVYATSTAVVGPLAVVAEPHTYDLCGTHARTLTAPRGWQLVRQEGELTPPEDDLAALAEAVWSRARRPPQRTAADPPPGRSGTPPSGRSGTLPRSGHLRPVPPS